MINRIVTLLLATVLSFTAWSQQASPPLQSSTGAAFPTPEEFVNAIDTTIIPKNVKRYYLVVGTDSCRFVKYDYDRWIQYVLREPLSINILNELSGKVYLSRYPYLWQQARLNKAICVTGKQADSLIQKQNVIFSFSLPQFTDDGQYAVIDCNFHCGRLCGEGTTYVFRLTVSGEWKLIGVCANWVS